MLITCLAGLNEFAPTHDSVGRVVGLLNWGGWLQAPAKSWSEKFRLKLSQAKTKQSRNSSSERQKMSNYSQIKSRIQMQDDEGNWRVPNEVLLHIASLVEDREGLKMSCKKFYSIVCSCDGPRVMKINVDKVRMNAHAQTASLRY